MPTTMTFVRQIHATDPHFPLEPVPEKKRLELLGNSECVNVLEALLWRTGEMFPEIKLADSAAGSRDDSAS